MEFGQWTRISGTAAGTTVISNKYSNLVKVLIPVTKAGTVTFYDAASAAGTSSSNEIMEVTNQPNAARFPVSMDCHLRVKNGLVAIQSGATDMTVVWSG